KLAEGQTLSPAEATAFFEACLRGEPTPAQIAAAVTAMKLRGEHLDEILAGARAMRAAALRLAHPFTVIDTCGTGGDGAHTRNISTAVALVVAGAGVRVAKHGTRAVSSRSGSSDVLAALGVNIQASPAQCLAALEQARICFLFAPAHHAALRHVMPVRQELGYRTIFNLLGPLSNPAGATAQVLGVYDARWCTPLAEVLGALGCTRAFVVHGSDGLDELTLTGPSEVAEWTGAGVKTYRLDPRELGLDLCALEALRGGDPEDNARALRAVLVGETGAYRDIVCLNAAAALMAADRATDWADGLALARQSLDSGAAKTALDQLVHYSHLEPSGAA
ncbi:MAG: anthranilate phosphoribosyltransferase, partial [Asticcacaulis sp.]